MLTTENLCNLKDDEVQRTIKVLNIIGLTKSTSPDNYSFVVHVKDEYDYKFKSARRDEIFDAIKVCYFNTMNKNLPIYGVSTSLDRYITSKKESKNGITKVPPSKFQLIEEDVFRPRSKAPSVISSGDGGLTIDEEDMFSYSALQEATPIYVRKGDISLSDFEIKFVIGSGRHGKVLLVQKRDDDEVYAMKTLRKEDIIN